MASFPKPCWPLILLSGLFTKPTPFYSLMLNLSKRQWLDVCQRNERECTKAAYILILSLTPFWPLTILLYLSSPFPNGSLSLPFIIFSSILESSLGIVTLQIETSWFYTGFGYLFQQMSLLSPIVLSRPETSRD